MLDVSIWFSMVIMVFGHDIMTWNGFVHPLKEKNAFDELPKNDRSRCLRAMDSITSMGRGSGRPGLATFFLGLVVLAGLNSGEQQFLICGTSSGWIVFVPLRSRLSCEKSCSLCVCGGVGALQRGVGTVQHKAWICNRVWRDFENWSVTQEFLRSREELAIPFFRAWNEIGR